VESGGSRGKIRHSNGDTPRHGLATKRERPGNWTLRFGGHTPARMEVRRKERRENRIRRSFAQFFRTFAIRNVRSVLAGLVALAGKSLGHAISARKGGGFKPVGKGKRPHVKGMQCQRSR